jgi:hypothetical protein
MNVAMIDIPNVWGMLLSREWDTTLGGNLHTKMYAGWILDLSLFVALLKTLGLA